MCAWLRRHRAVAVLFWTAVALAATEGVLVIHYLGSWLTLPLP
jgi:hypothetical protein